MRLFFFIKSRSNKGFQRKINPKHLDFYAHRSDHSKKNRAFLNLVFNLHMLEFAIRLGSIIGIFFFAIGSFGLRIENASNGLTIPGAEYSQVLHEQRLSAALFVYENGVFHTEESWQTYSSEDLDKFLNWIVEEEPKSIVHIFADEKAEMSTILLIMDTCQKLELRNVFFATGRFDSPRVIR